MKTMEIYEIYVDGSWLKDVETPEEVKKEVEDWISNISYVEDELLDTVFEADVSVITVKMIVKEVIE